MNIHPYTRSDWFITLNEEQRVTYETRIGILCGQGPINPEAHEIALREAQGFTVGKQREPL